VVALNTAIHNYTTSKPLQEPEDVDNSSGDVEDEDSSDDEEVDVMALAADLERIKRDVQSSIQSEESEGVWCGVL